MPVPWHRGAWCVCLYQYFWSCEERCKSCPQGRQGGDMKQITVLADRSLIYTIISYHTCEQTLLRWGADSKNVMIFEAIIQIIPPSFVIKSPDLALLIIEYKACRRPQSYQRDACAMKTNPLLTSHIKLWLHKVYQATIHFLWLIYPCRDVWYYPGGCQTNRHLSTYMLTISIIFANILTTSHLAGYKLLLQANSCSPNRWVVALDTKIILPQW